MNLKTLVLVRHGKSSWEYPNLSDFERPLKKRATLDAQLVSKAFLDGNIHTYTAFSSGANRAFSTAQMFAKYLGSKVSTLEAKEELYTFSGLEILKFIKETSNQIDHLMLFGHNPALTEIANQMGNQSFANIPTTGLVQINFEIHSWTDAFGGKTQLYLFPKYLK